MRISFVSDIHGNADALAVVAGQAEQLVVLGDLLDYVDYHDPGAGILGEVFGADRVSEFTALRSAGDFVGLHRLNSDLWSAMDDPVGTLAEVVDRRYRQMLNALSYATSAPLLILGNVDVLAAWQAVAGDQLPNVDGQVVELAGRRFGFVAGGASRHARPREVVAAMAWRPYMRPVGEYLATVADLGDVDVLCSHLPPNLPALRYDQLPARLEAYGPGLLESIDAHQPQLAVFGHVHQPMAPRLRHRRTECVNVGHFARRPRAFEVQW